MIRQLWDIFSGDDARVAVDMREMIESVFKPFPWDARVTDWTGQSYMVGNGVPHWSGHKLLDIRIKTARAGRALLALDGMSFLEHFLDQDVDLTGNVYLLSEIRAYGGLKLRPWQVLVHRLRNSFFQDLARAKASVKSHYDMVEGAHFYLDEVLRSHSCGFWERPHDLRIEDALTVGKGEGDATDTLEKAQWRQRADSSDFLAPRPGDSVLDIGCGAGGFMRVLKQRCKVKTVVGWTHSANQVKESLKMLEGFDGCEVNEGDYRQDERIYDHIHSTGMVCHVGPKGLVPYVKNVRRRIKTGGRYIHHCMMAAPTGNPLFSYIGPAFNAKYIWPGFYFFSLGQHIKALEDNGFRVVKVLNLAPHYAKTARAWFERLLVQRERFVGLTNEATARAFEVYLGGGAACFINRRVNLMRVYCEAIDLNNPSLAQSDPSLIPYPKL
jgi:cyclopropane fatty-acyl-phospholipid synthase-like methyltransferase